MRGVQENPFYFRGICSGNRTSSKQTSLKTRKGFWPWEETKIRCNTLPGHRKRWNLFGFGRLDGSSSDFPVCSNTEEISLLICWVDNTSLPWSQRETTAPDPLSTDRRGTRRLPNEFTASLPTAQRSAPRSQLATIQTACWQQLRSENKRFTETKDCGIQQRPGHTARVQHTTRHAIHFKESCTGPNTARPLPDPSTNHGPGAVEKPSPFPPALQLCLGQTFPSRPMSRHMDPRAEQFSV